MPQELQNNISAIHKSLSVLISQDGLSFYIYHDQKVLDQWNTSFERSMNPSFILEQVEKEFERKQALSSAFQKVTLLYNHDLFCLVPAAIFQENNAADYLKYNARLLKTDLISHEKVDNVVIVYIAFENINNHFFEKVGSFDYYHYGSQLLKLQTDKAPKDQNVIYTDFFDHKFYMSIYKSAELQSLNLFPYESIEDALYYVMFGLQQHDFDPAKVLLILRGEDSISTVEELLNAYVSNIQVKVNQATYQEKLLCV